MSVVGGPGSRITRTPTDDAHTMCAAAKAMLEDEWRAQRLRVVGELEARLARSRPSDAGR